MIRINLLPQAERAKKPTTVRGSIFVILGAVALVAVMALLWLNLKMQISDLNQQIEQAQAELVKYQAIEKEVAKYRADKRNLEEKLASIDRLKAGQVGPVHVLDEVSRLLPQGMWLTSLNNSASRLTLQGFAFSNFTIADFMTQLTKAPSGRFTEVDLTYSEQTKIGKVPIEKFEVTCSIKL